MTVKASNQVSGQNWTAFHGDSCQLIKGLPDNSIDFQVYSPPFSSLYCYTNMKEDMGNCRTHEQFFQHYSFLVSELYRVLKPGRLCAVHCMILPTSKQKDGYIGLYDFPGELVKCHEKHGFIHHSEVTIRKDPVTAMQRTKAIGLLQKQLEKDSAMSRMGIPDVVLVFRKPGENAEPIEGGLDHYVGIEKGLNGGTSRGDAIDRWQRYAEPVWNDIETRFSELLPTLTPEQAELFFQILNHSTSDDRIQIWNDINPSNTLQYQSARDNNDQRHIAPLQLDVIHRLLQLYSNPGDTILTPFGGIGSEGYEALKMGRKAILFELKGTYFKCLCNNLDKLETELQSSLFGALQYA